MSWSQLPRSQARAEASPNLLTGFCIFCGECRPLLHSSVGLIIQEFTGVKETTLSQCFQKGNFWTASSREIHTQTEHETPVCRSLPLIWTSWEVPLSPKKHQIILLFHTLRFCFWSPVSSKTCDKYFLIKSCNLLFHGMFLVHPGRWLEKPIQLLIIHQPSKLVGIFLSTQHTSWVLSFWVLKYHSLFSPY